MKSILIQKKKDNIIFGIGVDEMVYKTDVNSFIEDTGVTVSNIAFPIEAYYIKLSDYSKTFICGNIMENILIELNQNDITNKLIVIDFDKVEEISENFLDRYTKILLQTSNKILTINMNTELSNQFSAFVLKSIKSPEEDEEE